MVAATPGVNDCATASYALPSRPRRHHHPPTPYANPPYARISVPPLTPPPRLPQGWIEPLSEEEAAAGGPAFVFENKLVGTAIPPEFHNAIEKVGGGWRSARVRHAGPRRAGGRVSTRCAEQVAHPAVLVGRNAAAPLHRPSTYRAPCLNTDAGTLNFVIYNHFVLHVNDNFLLSLATQGFAEAANSGALIGAPVHVSRAVAPWPCDRQAGRGAGRRPCPPMCRAPHPTPCRRTLLRPMSHTSSLA